MASGKLIPMWGLVSCALGALIFVSTGRTQAPTTAQANQASTGAMLTRYCSGCHNAKAKTAGIVLDGDAITHISENAEMWEKVVRQLRSRGMPPPPAPRPEAAAYASAATFVENTLDRAAAANPNPGDLPTLHRLTRTEYKNAIRDLLGLDNLPAEMDYELLLPADNASSGFDNIADLLYVSPAVMERYLDASRKISRLALGDMQAPLMVNIHRTPLEQRQERQVEELGFGTRGGMAIHSYFPTDGEYVFDIENAGGGRDQHQLEITVDGERKKLIEVGGAAGGRGRGRGAAPAPENRVAITAGPHLIGITFVQLTQAVEEATLKPRVRSRGNQPALAGVTIRGPFNPTGPGNTPSRQKILICRPAAAAEETACAKRILTALVRRAYRRAPTDTDINDLMPFFVDGRKERDFDYGIQSAVERLLVSPQFLYRIEAGRGNGSTFPVTDLELASRLSFFLWASIPDDQLLDVAIAGKLRDKAVLRAQTERMLKDERSKAMVNNFAAQWLFLRDVDVKEPDLFLFRDFDEGLRHSFNRETELFLDSVLRENRPVSELITSNYTFVNERLAEHYGIPGVRGSHYRKVTFPAGSPRGGLLGQGSLLLVTSYSTRTSPVLRGKYILENLLATPPPPPPPNVPALKTEGDSADTPRTLRESMVLHRANPACASCHARMDPLGFALENFDATGRWRDHDAGNPIDVKSALPDGTEVNGVDGIKQLLLKDPERFASAVTEKLLMYAAGRNVQYYDAPAVRKIVRDAAKDKYAFYSLVQGVVESVPFQMRKVKGAK